MKSLVRIILTLILFFPVACSTLQGPEGLESQNTFSDQGIVDSESGVESGDTGNWIPSGESGENGGPDVASVEDSDGDGIPDVEDNCPERKNADQADSNGNGQGDACEISPQVGVIIDEGTYVGKGAQPVPEVGPGLEYVPLFQIVPENFGEDMPLVLIGSENQGSQIHVKVGGVWGENPRVQAQGGVGDYNMWVEGCTPEALGTTYDDISQFPLVAMNFQSEQSHVGTLNAQGVAELNLQFLFFEEPSDSGALETTCTIMGSSGGQTTRLKMKVRYYPADEIPTQVQGTAVEDK